MNKYIHTRFSLKRPTEPEMDLKVVELPRDNCILFSGQNKKIKPNHLNGENLDILPIVPTIDRNVNQIIEQILGSPLATSEIVPQTVTDSRYFPSPKAPPSCSSDMINLQQRQDSSDSEEMLSTPSLAKAMSELAAEEHAGERNSPKGIKSPKARFSDDAAACALGIQIRLKEYGTAEETLVGGEILQYQGQRHNQDEISRMFKKDCRTWLWKGSNRTRKVTVPDLQSETEKLDIK